MTRAQRLERARLDDRDAEGALAHLGRDQIGARAGERPGERSEQQAGGREQRQRAGRPAAQRLGQAEQVLAASSARGRSHGRTARPSAAAAARARTRPARALLDDGDVRGHGVNSVRTSERARRALQLEPGDRPARHQLHEGAAGRHQAALGVDDVEVAAEAALVA